MLPGVSPEALALIVLMLAGAGLLTGFVSGLFGIGGGSIMVPILYEAFGLWGVDDGIRMHLSVGTSLAVMIPTALASFQGHSKHGNVDKAFITRLVLPVVAGVVMGSIVAKYADGNFLQSVWVVVALLIAGRQFLGGAAGLLGNEIPKSRLLELWGVVVGMISTLMSIGGGAFIITTLALFGRSMHVAVGTSSGFGPVVAIPGMIGFIWAGWNVAGAPPFTLGYVNFLTPLFMVPAAVFAVPLGVGAANWLPKRSLELGYGAFMLMIAIRFALELFV